MTTATRWSGDLAGFAVRTSGLTRDYGNAGLFDVDLLVPAGSVFGLVGPNGAGKTTLLSIITGTRHADAGVVETAIDPKRTAFCPDVPEFEPWLTAHEVIELSQYLLGGSTAAATVGHALAVAGLDDAGSRRTGGFSRGMLQRLGLACAVAADPELLILDEPTSALDPAGRADILSFVAGQRGARTVIFSSHILADVQRVADHVAILRDGRLLYQGATQDLVDTHLRPRWRLRLAGGTADVLTALQHQPWVLDAAQTGTDEVTIDAATLEDGERGIPAAVARSGARQVSCEPVSADLEAAFLALTKAAA